MNLTIESLKFKTDAKLEEFINEKVSKLSTLNPDIITAKVVLQLEKNDDRENKILDITLDLRGHKLHTSQNAKSFEEACLEAIDALKSQLSKLKRA